MQHAHNPVDWHPWGEKAFKIAQEEQKPIFLSVGYSACHWCRVMEREVFQDPHTAQDLNEKFVCIKVDREQRPEVDHVYMIAMQIVTGSGGWPMNVFLTPPAPTSKKNDDGAKKTAGDELIGYGLKPFYCVAYLPPIAEDGRPSFPTVVETLHSAWATKREAVLRQAERLADLVSDEMAEPKSSGPVDQALAARAAQKILKSYDPANGGFGASKEGPKFPEPSKLRFLLKLCQSSATKTLMVDANLPEAVMNTLDRMALGGIYDHLGGGFHRYATDGEWNAPHFEKMLCDNGQLLVVYADALQLLRRRGEGDSARAARYERVLRGTSDYMLRDMIDPTGAFCSAQSAEVDGVEGASYLWTMTQVRSAIDNPELASLAIKLYGLSEEANDQAPNTPDNEPAQVLYLAKPLTVLAEELSMPPPQLLEKQRVINARLKAARDKRPQPRIDDKVLAAWNGLAIEGLTAAGVALGEPRYLRTSRQAAEAILQHMATGDGGLYRTMRNGRCQMPALLADYSHLTAGLLALAGVQDENDLLLDEAERLTRYAMKHFAAGSGGYYDTTEEASELFVRICVTYDDALPSGNSVMMQNLVGLYQATGKQGLLHRVVEDLRSFSGDLSDNGQAMPAMAAVLLDLSDIKASDTLLAAPAED